jgi:hypothetical protein
LPVDDRRVAHQADEIDAEQRFLDRRIMRRFQFVTRVGCTPGVSTKNDLAFRFRDDALNSEASRLRFIGDGGDLLPDESIEQSRFTRIRPPD